MPRRSNANEAKDVEFHDRAALEQEFGLKTPEVDTEVLPPHRKRMLFLACACILGELAHDDEHF